MGDSRGSYPPSVILADATPSREFEVLEWMLTTGFGVPVLRLGRAQLNQEFASLPTDPVSTSSGQEGVSTSHRRAPTVVWLRHASPQAIYGAADGDTAPPPWAHTCSTRLHRWATVATTAIPGTEPSPSQQLADASQRGIRVPTTIFTTDVSAAAASLAAPKVVVKASGPRWREPNAEQGFGPAVIVDSGDALPSWSGGTAPLAVQEYVEHTRELRAYYLHGAICTFEVRKPTPASLWDDPESVYVTPVACPQPVVEIVKTLSAMWALRFGAFDLLETSTGDPVFLEVNVDGDWLYYERKAGWNGVTLTAATMLYEQHVQVQ